MNSFDNMHVDSHRDVHLTTSIQSNNKNTELRANLLTESLSKWQTPMLKHINRIDINCHSPDFVHVFSYVENVGYVGLKKQKCL